MDLFVLLPRYWEKNQKMRELQEIVSEEAGDVADRLDYKTAQALPKTATEEIGRWEKIYNVTPDLSQSFDQRREKLAAKMQGSSATTKSLIESIASSYSHADVEIEELSAQYKVIITFTGTIGVPESLEDIKKSIQELLPAHLVVEYVFVYNTYAKVSEFTHQELSALTHGAIRASEL